MKHPASVGFGVLLGLILGTAGASDKECRIYDPDPAHLWNRLHETLFVRVAADGARYGCDRIDPLYWYDTRHIIASESHLEAIRILDEFLKKHGERSIRDPLKHSFLQHDLWTLIDWSANHDAWDDLTPQRKALQRRLVTAIKRLALTKIEIEALPDNYAASLADPGLAKLPQELFGKTAWVELRARDVVAPLHTQSFGGRSEFRVLLRLPGGRDATLAYLERLRPFERVWTLDDEAPDGELRFSYVANLPQFPQGTQWALVRSMLVIDTDGDIRRTSIVESVQMRTYDIVSPGPAISAEEDEKAQRHFEFVAERSRAGQLRAIQAGERDFGQFMVHSADPFEGARELSAGSDEFGGHFVRESLARCRNCHARASGIYSVRSFVPFLGGSTKVAGLEFWAAEADETFQSTRNWKRSQYDFGLLRGLWERAD